MIYGPHLCGSSRLSPFNVSPDRLTCDVRQYRAWLIRLLCAFCKIVRMANTIEGGKEQVVASQDAYRHGETTFKDDFVCSRAAPAKLTAAGEKVAEGRAEAQVGAIKRREQDSQKE